MLELELLIATASFIVAIAAIAYAIVRWTKGINVKLENLDTRLKSVETRLTSVEVRLTSVENITAFLVFLHLDQILGHYYRSSPFCSIDEKEILLSKLKGRKLTTHEVERLKELLERQRAEALEKGLASKVIVIDCLLLVLRSLPTLVCEGTSLSITKVRGFPDPFFYKGFAIS